MKQSGRPGPVTRVVAWWRARPPKVKTSVAVCVVAIAVVGNLTEPEQAPAPAGRAAASSSPTTSAPAEPSSAPEESQAPMCGLAGTPPPAADASGPLRHITLGTLRCRFDEGRLDQAGIPVTVRNKGDGTAAYTVTLQLLDADGHVVSTDDVKVHGLASGAQETTRAALVRRGEKAGTDGDGYHVRVAQVERAVEPETQPTGDTDVDLPDVHRDRSCKKRGTGGLSGGRGHTCRGGYGHR